MGPYLMSLGYREPEHKKLSLSDDLKLISVCLKVEELILNKDINNLRKLLLPLVKGA